jgi:hypothetical protein
MNKTIFIFLTVHFSLITFHCLAQDFKLIKATSQHWSGGACCKHGINYVVQIETKSDKITPDTIWINGNFYPVMFSDKSITGTSKKYDSLKHVFNFIIAVGESYDDAQFPHWDSVPREDTTDVKPKKEFIGAALISYQLKKKQCTFIIKEFTLLPNLAYP